MWVRPSTANLAPGRAHVAMVNLDHFELVTLVQQMEAGYEIWLVQAVKGAQQQVLAAVRDERQARRLLDIILGDLAAGEPISDLTGQEPGASRAGSSGGALSRRLQG